MAYLTWCVRILLFLILLGFAVRNLDVIHVHGFLGYEWSAPLALVLLVSLVAGACLGVAGSLTTVFALRRPPDAPGRDPSRTPPPSPGGGAPAPVRSPTSPLAASELNPGDEGA